MRVILTIAVLAFMLYTCAEQPQILEWRLTVKGEHIYYDEVTDCAEDRDQVLKATAEIKQQYPSFNIEVSKCQLMLNRKTILTAAKAWGKQ